MVHEFVRIRGEFEFERIRANSNLHPYFPYKRFFVSRDTNPNGDIEKKLGSKLFKIDHSIKVVADPTKGALDAFTRNTHLLRGASF